ncbi:MAG: GNAT family N-acetyltransferase [Cytophagia bacterium]|nr:GNAT family N-acetyltransferase [Cytophagia bacterium]
MKIRKALLSDIPVIKEIAEKAWRPTYDHILTEQQTLYMLDLMYNSQTLENQIKGNIAFFMVDLGQETVGYFAIEILNEQKVKLHKLYLDPTQKQKGLGRKIIQYIMDWALTNQSNRIILNVNKNNSAVQFYLKMGFKIIEEIILDIGEGYVMDDFVMQLDLGSTQSIA